MKPPYALIPIVILVLLIYGISFLASRVSIIQTTTHRKIWNTLLLITFLATACLGIILAIQVNYKIKIPFVDDLLVWHVDFGIAMALVAIFHFTWHVKYYISLFRRNDSRQDSSSIQKKTETRYALPDRESLEKIPLKRIIIILGFSAIITQIILLREFMSIFYGNELVLGIVLANWMILTGLGAYLGRLLNRLGNTKQFLFYALVSIGVIPVFTVLILNGLKNLVFIEGSMVGLLQIFTWSGLLMIPYCILSGSLFTYLSQLISIQGKQNLIHRVYSLEAVGSVIGGLAFNFIMVFFLKSFQSLCILLTINIFCAFWFFPIMRKPGKLITGILLWILMFMASFFWNLDYLAKKPLFKNQDLLLLKESPYGNIAITKTGDQLNFYDNYVLLFNTLNTIANEESVHYAMVQHTNPKSVLVISGGISGILDEILKYPVDRIDYVELNPWLIKASKQFHQFTESPKIHIHNEDARLYLKHNVQKYDVVLINIPPPGSAQLNRYYTIEFLKDLQASLTAEGLIALSLPTSMNYISEEASEVNSIIYNTLDSIFTYVDIVPGEKNFFIASEIMIDLNIAALVDRKEINNEYVNRYFIDDQLLLTRRDIAMGTIHQDTEINADFTPRAYLKQIAYWLSYFDLNLWVIWLPVFILIPFLIIRRNPIQIGMFTVGFSASAIELLLLISFQIIYGYVYQVAGIIITLFMAGLALGPFLQKRILPSPEIRHVLIIQILIGVFSVLLPLIFLLFRIIDPGSGLIHIIFFLLTLIISIMTGFFFSLASILQQGDIAKVASGIYGSDLIGSAIGVLLVAALLFPLIGLINVLLLIGGLNFVAALYTLSQKKRLTNIFVS